MSELIVEPGLTDGGDIAVLPMDKSISHRALLAASLAPGGCLIKGLNRGRAVIALVDVLRELGVEVEDDGASVRVGPLPSSAKNVPTLQFGGSSTAARLFMGVAAGRGIECIIDGDESLRRRPMDWVVAPLRAWGARVRYLGSVGRLPVRVELGTLRSAKVEMAVGSAQARSGVLYAAAAAGVPVRVGYTVGSRDHTERLFAFLGAKLAIGAREIFFDPSSMRFPSELLAPIDPSACAYLVAAHLLLRRRKALSIGGVCLNPGRTGFFEVLRSAGFDVRYENVEMVQGEPVGTIVVPPAGAAGRPFEIGGDGVLQTLIDEVPLSAAVAATLPGTSIIRNGAELKFKETDRLETTRRMLGALGARISVEEDGLRIVGGRPLQGAEVPSFGDHRIAMSAVTVAATASARSRVQDGCCVIESFPAFEAAMRSIGVKVRASK